MTSEEFSNFYNKNKLLVIGIPIILAILFVDNFILKPARNKKNGVATQVETAQPAAGAVSSANAPVVPPPPISTPFIPPLDSRVDSRFAATETYPYNANRMVFYVTPPKMEELKVEAASVEENQEEVIQKPVERPDISYHGFLTMGKEKVAIMKITDRLTLSRIGQKLKDSPFLLREIFPDRVVIDDSEEPDRQFEVALAGIEKSTKTAKAE